ncbi:hypothetical protein [Amycolatopsis sp. DG1A-15b]|uniref:hypothetical protein n=1 Tax=Amycolatopsis sp. DG1A-15b TaxID=3052846 RepID=UPI00255B57FA|nr:hypothetical protein [Amycolatopsis sp. DG1A-15b]WIX87499.1 hypothetical protein QRY02_41190 [Amycolatopsis sp. DG1A-15b]
MDRSPQEPAAHPDGAESPLSFPVEAPRPDGPEPGAGAPASFPAEPGATRPTDPLAFPAEAAPRSGPPLFPPHITATPSQAEPLPFPVAELPVSAATPQPAPEAEPEPAPAAAGLLHRLPAVLAALAAVLAVGGCFLPLFRMLQDLNFRQGFIGAQLTITETAWGNRIEITGQPVTDRPGVPVGIPVVIAVVVLAVAAIAAFARPDRGLTRWLLSAGALFTAGVVTTTWMSRFELAAIADEEAGLEVSTGPGMWLLTLATVLAAAAAVLGYLPLRNFGRNPGWADPALAYADTPTPPSGVAITVLPPDDEQP